jgi:alpha,alpha-trehalase
VGATNQLIDKCANLNSVDVNSFLFKYEKKDGYLSRTWPQFFFTVVMLLILPPKGGNKTIFTQNKINGVLEQQECIFLTMIMGNQKQFQQGGSNIFFHSLGGIMCDSNQAKKLIDTLPQLSKQAALLGITKE